MDNISKGDIGWIADNSPKVVSSDTSISKISVEELTILREEAVIKLKELKLAIASMYAVNKDKNTYDSIISLHTIKI